MLVDTILKEFERKDLIFMLNFENFCKEFFENYKDCLYGLKTAVIVDGIDLIIADTIFSDFCDRAVKARESGDLWTAQDELDFLFIPDFYDEYYMLYQTGKVCEEFDTTCNLDEVLNRGE